MRDVSLAEAKAQPGHVIAEAGEAARKPIDLARLQAVTAAMTEAATAREPFVRQMRDEDRY